MYRWDNQIIQKITLENEFEKLEPLTGKKVSVFPFKIVTGVTNLTETGEKPSDFVSEDFTSFFQVLNGKSSVVAVWENSTSATTDEISVADPTQGLLATYKVGKFYDGYVQSDSTSPNIGSLNGYNEYTAFKPSKNVTISFDNSYFTKYLEKTTDKEIFEKIKFTCWDLNPDDTLRFYIIPEVFGNQWMVIDNCQKYYRTDGTLERVDVSFRTVADELASTAGVKTSLIQPSAGGEGYAWPEIYFEETEQGKIKKIKLSEKRLISYGVTSQQIRCEGIAGFNNMIAFGRPVYRKDLDVKLDENGEYKKRIITPRLLLPERTLPAINDNLSFQATPIDNYYLAARGKNLFREIYKDWKEKINVQYAPLQAPNFEGAIDIGGASNENAQDVKMTNPLSGDKYLYSIKDNPRINVSTKSINYETNATGACEKSITLYSDRSYSYGELLCHNYFITQPMTRMPQGKNSTVSWSYNSLPVVGGFAKMLTSGVNYGFQTNTTKIPTPNIPLFIPSDVCEMQADSTGGSLLNWTLPYELFRFDGSDQMSALTGLGNFNCSLRTKLTHLFEKDGVIYDTVYLGQTKDPHGNEIPELKWSEDCFPTDKNRKQTSQADEVVGYIIDAHFNTTIFSGNYNLVLYGGSEMYQNEYQVSNFKLMTKSYNTKSIREWRNMFTFSYWREGFNTEGIMNWPEAIVLPIKSQDIDSNVTCDDYQTMNIENNLEHWNQHWKDNSTKENPFEGVTIKFPDSYDEVGTDWDKKHTISYENRTLEYGWGPGNGRYEDKSDRTQYHGYIDLITCLNNNVTAQQRIYNYEELKQQFRSIQFTFKMDRSYIGNYAKGSLGSDEIYFELSTEDLLRMVNGELDYSWKDSQNYTSYGSGYLQYVGWYLVGFVVPHKSSYSRIITWSLRNFWYDKEKDRFGFNSSFLSDWYYTETLFNQSSKKGSAYYSKVICSKIVFVK